MCCVVAAGHEVQRYVVTANGGLDSGKLVRCVLKGAEVCCVVEPRSWQWQAC